MTNDRIHSFSRPGNAVSSAGGAVTSTALNMPGATSDPERKPRVLVVDDNEDVRDLLRLHLVAGGFDVEMAENGQQAIDSIASAPPDLMLTDLNMPGMDGSECTAPQALV